MRTRELVKRLTVLCVASIVSLLLAEVALRIYTSFDSPLGRELAVFDPLGVKIEPIGELGYKQRPNAVFSYSTGTEARSNAEGFRGPVVEIPKPAGTYRIILLGGSTTHGWGVEEDETIDAYMRHELGRRYPDRTFEAVNLAFDGYDSYQLYERLKNDGLRFQPDLIIANTGINDVWNARLANLQDRDPRTLVWKPVLDRLRAENERGGPSLWTRIKHYSLLARLPGFVLKKQNQTREMDSVHRATLHDGAVENFERNLRRIAQVARDHSVPLLFSTPPSSLEDNYAPDTPPERAYWIIDAATTQRYRDRLANRMQDVVSDLNATQPIAYVPHDLPGDMFIDDAHLTAEGNRRMALDFVEAATPFVEASDRATSSTDGQEDVKRVAGRGR